MGFRGLGLRAMSAVDKRDGGPKYIIDIPACVLNIDVDLGEVTRKVSLA